MSFDEVLRQIVREEVRSALRDASPTPSLSVSAGEELITIGEAAALVKLSPAFIRRWRDEGKLTPYGTGRSSRVSKPEVLQVLRQSALDARGATLSDAEIDAKADAILRGRR